MAFTPLLPFAFATTRSASKSLRLNAMASDRFSKASFMAFSDETDKNFIDVPPSVFLAFSPFLGAKGAIISTFSLPCKLINDFKFKLATSISRLAVATAFRAFRFSNFNCKISFLLFLPNSNFSYAMRKIFSVLLKFVLAICKFTCAKSKSKKY